MGNQDPVQKKRRPPTFRHLPWNRAKKLKQTWVEVQKIKSQWKAQKRREGIVTRAVPPHLSLENAEDSKQGKELDEDNDDDQAMSDTGVSDNDEQASSGSSSEDEESESEGEERPARSAISARGSRGRGRGLHKSTIMKRKRDEKEEEEEPEKPSLRELQRQAYSQSTLHTYKSHSTRGAHKGSQGGDRGRGSRGRGRGQPDMRLRMNVMLEKIKRDFV